MPDTMLLIPQIIEIDVILLIVSGIAISFLEGACGRGQTEGTVTRSPYTTMLSKIFEAVKGEGILVMRHYLCSLGLVHELCKSRRV